MLKYLTDEQLIHDTNLIAHEIRTQTLKLLEHLSEIFRRKLFTELGYSCLFNYINDELKFSGSQAAIYNTIVKSRVLAIEPVQEKIESGELSLFALSVACKEINEQKIIAPDKKMQIIQSVEGASKEELKRRNKKQKLESLKLEIPERVVNKLEAVKRKKKLGIDLVALIEFLADEALGVHEVSKNSLLPSTITPKLKRTLLRRAKYQCEGQTLDGKRCDGTKFLEIDHLLPRALGGSNSINNLRVLCRAHNQRASWKQFQKSHPLRPAK